MTIMMNNLIAQSVKCFLLVGMLAGASWLYAAEENDGELGKVSAGNVDLTLRILQGINAGFLRTNLDDPESDFQQVESYRLVDDLLEDGITTIPLCIIASDDGAFAIDTYEQDGQQNLLYSQYGSEVPIEILIGEKTENSRFKSVRESCTEGDTIPVTIRTVRNPSGKELGLLRGKFNLLVKTE